MIPCPRCNDLHSIGVERCHCGSNLVLTARNRRDRARYLRHRRVERIARTVGKR